jgi:hypothetical protein
MTSAEKIEHLTADQEVALAAHYEKWLRTGLSCEPADRPRTEQAITAVYKKMLKAEPPKFLWFSSPAVCQLAMHVLKNLKVPQMEDQLWGQLRDQLWGQL